MACRIFSLQNRFALCCFSLLLVSAASVFGQVPDKFTNLQVLPKDIGKGELLDHMKGFTRALGVRCQHCHVGEEGKPLDTFNFVSDEKPAKQTARVMLQMVQAINNEHLAKVANRSTPPSKTSCITCHHGQQRPRLLEEVLHEAIAAQGIAAGMAKYRELREQYYGGFVFDFSESTLLRLAQQLQMEKKIDEAIAVLKLNAEFYPNSWMSYHQLAELYATQGDKAAAMEHYKQSLARNPQNGMAKKRLEELERK